MMHSTQLPTSNFLTKTTKPRSHLKASTYNIIVNGGSRNPERRFDLCPIQTHRKNLLKEEPLLLQRSSGGLLLCNCGRRHFVESAIVTSLIPSLPSLAFDLNLSSMETLNKIHPPKPEWYEELYAYVLNYGMKKYEAEIAGHKSQLFNRLKGQAKEVVELGIGTGPNLKYYASDNDMRVIGVDPNTKMEKYARGAAEAAGLSPANFEFVHAVGEGLPLSDASVDAVIGTLVLCSVKDVDGTLKEIMRVLKPGGLYLFVEHVAAKDGTSLRLVQNILDPLQQFVADGCHLTRETETYIAQAGFSGVECSMQHISSASFTNPHLFGIASK